MNFMALVVIADFDDFFYGALFDTAYKDVITNKEGTYDEFLMLQMTTSVDARYELTGNRVVRQDCEKVHERTPVEGQEQTMFQMEDPDNPNHNYHDFVPKHIYVKFWRRRCDNKLFYIIYILFRVLIVSVWYYFVPFLALIANFAVPALLKLRSESPE